jgi:hypothetical protein
MAFMPTSGPAESTEGNGHDCSPLRPSSVVQHISLRPSSLSMVTQAAPKQGVRGRHAAGRACVPSSGQLSLPIRSRPAPRRSAFVTARGPKPTSVTLRQDPHAHRPTFSDAAGPRGLQLPGRRVCCGWRPNPCTNCGGGPARTREATNSVAWPGTGVWRCAVTRDLHHTARKESRADDEGQHWPRSSAVDTLITPVRSTSVPDGGQHRFHVGLA